jgi:hypothetical protein
MPRGIPNKKKYVEPPVVERKRKKVEESLSASAEEEAPLDAVVKMTDIERLTAAKTEAELMNCMLNVRNHDLEIEALKRKFQEDMQSRNNHRAQLLASAETKRVEQLNLLQEIATRYNLDPKQMAYDPDTGALRDLRS